MKKVINELLYDTEESELLYTDTATDRKLYRTRKGNYFLAYPVGAITPKTEEETRVYLGSKDADAYIRVFGMPEEA